MQSETPPFLKPRLRLFLSADIVGSTALKQSQVASLRDNKEKRGTPWVYIIQGFYIEAKLALADEWKKACEKADGRGTPVGEAPLFWKTVGDEILFTKNLTDYRQLALMLECWMRTIERIRSDLQSRDERLDVKSTAWLAGFPVKNKDVVLSNAPSLAKYNGVNYLSVSGDLLNKYYDDPHTDEVTVDFVGPSVDVGFRLSAHATARRFVVSVGIAYILSLTVPDDDDVVTEIKFFYQGTVVLKGVFGGVPYPLFWIDVGKKTMSSSVEDKLTLVKHCDPRAVQDFCSAFYKENDRYTFRPFIDEPDEHQLKKQPLWYKDQLKLLVDEYYRPITNIDDGLEPEEPAEIDESQAAEDIMSFLNESQIDLSEKKTSLP